MNKKIAGWRSAAAGTLMMMTMAAPAWAALPHGTLQFVTPTATVAADAPIPVWVRLTLDADSPAMNFSSNPLTGFAAADLPTQGWHYNLDTGARTLLNFASVDRVYISAGMTCSSTFVCGPTNTSPNYSFEFASQHNPALPGPVYQDHFNLNPGESVSYLFGQFTPKAGGADAGTYGFHFAHMSLVFGGLSADGRYLVADANPAIVATTCSSGDLANCGFSRTVVAVPEPASWLLLGLGLPLLAAARRRRS